ncbi:hypothetical protein P8A18_19930 [Streptomyces castrisilvae]|uniref:Uncharacterized protein n=1 Tax=Streptomyces castrisilvae TaxID=3033811 RepID=A0ABY9HM22_9ACTN|nr:hypothetical protein [Streptomyces sp. Mut1]WLQ35545.1 hypothetical protein P8A18_19930 [Streptomyces sp. Mut1]
MAAANKRRGSTIRIIHITEVAMNTIETQPAEITIELPESFSAEAATLGRQPNNDGDNSGAMFFE